MGTNNNTLAFLCPGGDVANVIHSEPAEYAPIEDSFNPAIHRVNNAVKSRAVNAAGSVPPTPEVLLRFSSPPQELISKIQGRIDTLVQAAEVKKVPPKAKGRRQRETVKPISGLDVDALLGEEPKSAEISPNNAVPDFKHALEVADTDEAIREAARQMGDIIQTLITDSFGDSKYAQAVECCGVMREELNNLDEPAIFNTFVRDLKMKALSGTLGGDRREFWFNIRASRLGLIDKSQSELSEVSAQEAEEVSWHSPLVT